MVIPLTVGFLSGLWLGSLAPYFPCSILILFILIGGVLTFLERRDRFTSWRGNVLYASVLLGTVYWISALTLTGSPHDDLVFSNRAVPIEGTICEPVRHGPTRLVAIICSAGSEIEAVSKQKLTRLRLTWREPDRSLHQGETITVATRLRSPSGLVNPGGFDYGEYLEQQGIDAVGSVTGPGQVNVLVSPSYSLRWAVWRAIDQWREQIRMAAVNSLHGGALGMYLGMIIGEPDYLSPDTRDRFMATGTVHILSISGSHLGLIALGSFFLIRRGCRLLPSIWLLHLSRYLTPTRLAALLTAGAVVFYTLLAGAQVATVRSLVMILLFLLAVWMGRESDMIVTLAVAAWLILLHDPHALFDISFQLSFVSVLALALALDRSGRVKEEIEAAGTMARIGRWLKEYGRMTGAVTLATVPLVAHYFNQIPWAGFIGNVIVVPLAGFVLVPVGLLAAIGCVLMGSETLPAAGLNQAIGDVLLRIVDVLSALPWAEWHVAAPGITGIGTFYVLLIVAMWSPHWNWVKVGSTACAFSLLLFWMWSPRVWRDGELRVTFLDVGQGDACLIELPDRETILIDGGASYDTLDMGRAVVAPYLWNRGITHLDHVIGTHPQLDHVGGLAWTLEKFSVGRFWSNGMGREEAFYQRLQQSLHLHGIIEHTVKEGQVIVDTDVCRLSVLNPLDEGPVVRVGGAKNGSMLNNRSVVTRLQCGPHSFLFTADIETETIARLRADPLFQARVVKVPHHGARSSLDSDWIERIHPEVAVISVGRMNAYGHPTLPVLSAYEGAGARVFRTDRDGAVQVSAALSSPALTVRLARADKLERTHLGPMMLNMEHDNLTKWWRHAWPL